MTVNVSKLTAYAVLAHTRLEVSKLTAYAVVAGTRLQLSKLTAYAVMRTGGLQLSKLTTYAVLGNPPGPTNVRLPDIFAEPTTGGNPNERLCDIYSEVFSGGTPDVRLPLIFSEPLTGGNPEVRVPRIFIEVFCSIAKENPVPTDILPIASPINAPLSNGGQAPLLGLTWDVKKTPMFNTQVNKSVTLKELRTSYTEFPVYQFELNFELLSEQDGKTELQRLMGFFMNQRGQFGEWLFQDPSDYLLQGQQIGVGDGGVTGFTVVRTMGGFTDPIGQIDQSALFTFAAGAVDTGTDTVAVPAHGLATGFGPVQVTNPGTLPTGIAALTNYWLICPTSGTIKFATSRANALAGTAVNITAAGSGTNTTSNSIAVYDNGTEVAVADYTIALPNEIIFDSAPAAGHILTVDCKFYFICRFQQDVAEFNEFMSNLWELESMTFQSVLQ